VAQEDGAIRIVTKITTKDAEESLDSLEYQIKKSAKYMDTLRQKMDALKGQKIPTREYKDLQAELARAEKELQKLVAQQEDWEKIGITSGGAWDTLSEEIEKADYKIDDIKAKMQSLTDAGKDFTLGEETFEYKGYERQLKYEEEAIVKAGEHYKKLASDEDKLSEIKKNSTVVDQKMIDLLEQRNRLAEKLKELEKAGVAEGYEEHNQAYIEWKNAADAVKAYRAELDKQTDSGQAKIAQQEAKAAEKREEAQRRAEEQAEKALQKENARIQKEVENQAKLEAKEAERKAREEARINAIQAKEEAKRAKEIAAIQAQEQEEQRLAAIRENAVVGNQRIVEIMERRRQLAQEIADMEQAGVGVGYQQHDTAKQELASLDQEIKNYADGVEEVKESYSRLGQAAKKAFSIAHSAISKAGSGLKRFGGFVKSVFSSLTKSAHKSNSSLGALGARFKSLALSLLIFNQISKAFNAMISGMKEGFGNLYNEVGAFKSAIDGLKASSLTLKNSFAAAFRPLVEIAIPYIQRAIDAIANLMNIIGQFTAAITGQKTYTKAVKQTTAAIKDQTGAQNKQLSSLDKLNNLSSGSGGASGGGGAGNMFEEAPIESGILGVFDKLKELIENKDWEGLGAYIAEAINKGLQKVYDVINWNNVGPKVTAFVDAFTRTFNSLVDHLDWDLLGRVIGAGINTIVNTLNLLIEGIDWENLGVKISTGMRGLINEVNWGNLGNLLGNKFMIQWNIFTGFVDDMWRKNDFTKLTGWAELGISLGNAVNGLFEKIDFGEIAHALASGFNGVIQSIKNFIATAKWGDIADNISNGLNTMIHETEWEEAGAVLGDAVLELLGVFEQVANDTDWEEFGRGIGHFLENIPWGEILGTTFSIIWDILSGLISGLFDTDGGKVVLGIGAGVLAIAAFFNPAGALIAAIAGAVALIIANWDDIMDAVDELKGWVEEKWQGIKEAVTGTTTELRAHVSEDFAGMHDKIAETLRSSWQTTDTEWNDINRNVSDQMGHMKGNSRDALDSIGKHIRDTWTNVESNTRSTMEKTGRKIEDTWNQSQRNTARTFSSMKSTVASSASSMASNMSSRLTSMRGNINSFSTNAKAIWSNTYENMRSKNSVSWNDMSRVSSNGMRNVENTVSSGMNHTKSIWANIWDAIFGKVSGILGSIKGAVSSAMDAISGMISAISGALDSLFSKADSASKISIPSKGSGGSSGGKNSRMAAAAPYAAEALAALADTPIPGYANGQVIPTSMKRHLAILGDNTRETEVVSPLSTMKQANKEAILEVLSELGLTGGKTKNSGNETFVFQVDGNTFFEITREYAKEYFNRTGSSPYPI